MAGSTAKRIDYRIVLPPGWIAIALDDTVDRRADELAGLALGDVDAASRTRLRPVLATQIRQTLRDARASGGQDFYLPTEAVHGIPLGMSIVVAAATPPDGGAGSAAEALLSFATGDDSAIAATVGSQLAVRRFEDVEATLTADGEVETPASRRISYLTTPPGDDRLLLITGSVLKLPVFGGDELAEAMELLFDSLVQTMRFPAVAETTQTGVPA